jgi:uncharacterized protein (TIGR03435 family)
LNWIASQSFDIEGKAEAPSTTTEAQLYRMLQTLLADRFQLKLHRETRETAGYLLQIAPDGLKMKTPTGQEVRPGTMGGGPPSGGYMGGEAVPMSSIVTFVSTRLGRPIQDRTGLTGLYNWESPQRTLQPGRVALAGRNSPDGRGHDTDRSCRRFRTGPASASHRPEPNAARRVA